jgi:hypothetical protein
MLQELTAARERMRVLMLRLMPDTCVISTPTAGSTTDRSGNLSGTPTTVTTQCRLSARVSSTAGPESGLSPGRDFGRYTLDLPWGTAVAPNASLQVNGGQLYDIVELLDPAATDPVVQIVVERIGG